MIASWLEVSPCLNTSLDRYMLETVDILLHLQGRSGSVGIAYCFVKHRHWSYRQVLEYVWSKKPDVYPHSQLQGSLEKLFPRESSFQ